MITFKSDFLRVLSERGFIHQGLAPRTRAECPQWVDSSLRRIARIYPTFPFSNPVQTSS